MRQMFVVSPFEGGWCLKIASTGEVMFFKTCALAQRRGLALAAEAQAHHGHAEVHVRDLKGRLLGRWVDGLFHAEPLLPVETLIAA